MKVLEHVITVANRRGLRMRADRILGFPADHLPAMYPEAFASQ